MTGKDVIFKYCSNVASVEEAQAAEDIVLGLKINDYKYLDSHCPTGWGLNNFIPLCEDPEYKEKHFTDDDCKRCWEKALALEIPEKE